MFKPMRRRNPLLPDDLDYRTPGIGDGIQDMIDPSTRRAVDVYADAPVQQTPAEAERSWGDRLSDVASSLGAAQAFLDGDFSTGGELLSAGKKRRSEAQKAIESAATQQQIFNDLRSQGYSAAEARLMALNPQAIGTNFAERSGSYTLGKGDVRYNGNQMVGERADSFETPMGDRYNAYSDGRTERFYKEEAPLYQNVEGVGVFAMDRHRPGTLGGGSGSGIPSRAIDALRANPDKAGEFDAMFGSGSAARILGGGGSDVTGGFRTPYASAPRFR